MPDLKFRYVIKTRAKGKDYYYHRPTKTRLPDDPSSQEFLNRVDELNKQIGAEGWNSIAPRPKMDRQIYFIQATSGPIKIGIAKEPKTRLNGLQTSHFEKLELLAAVSGTEEEEKALHENFKKHRIRGEWYRPSDELIERIMAFLTPRMTNRFRKIAKPRKANIGEAQKIKEISQ